MCAGTMAKMKPGQPIPEKWKLFVKFFCYLKPHSVPSDSIESVFLYDRSECEFWSSSVK